MSKSQQKMEASQTVLLRHPLPKYSFQARKLPKETSSNTDSVQADTKGSDHMTKTALDSTKSKDTTTPSPISVEGERHQAARRENGADKKSATVRPLPAAPKIEPFTVAAKPVAAVMASQKQTYRMQGQVDDVSVNELVEAALSREKESRHQKTRVDSSTASHATETVRGLDEYQAASVGVTSAITCPAPTGVAVSPGVPVPDAGLLAQAIEGPSETEKLKKAEQEIEMLKSQLEVQLQVNAELKRLLVASVGDDFERRIENLARDRAQLAMELGDFTKKMTEDYENLDQISIQADMWRTKYLASRVMVEELASGRAFYSAQFHDSQQAMQQLLNERYELRAQMLQAYKCLQQVKEAFDPLNTHRSHGLTSTNVLDLSKSIKQLSEAVRFRLLPAHAGAHVIMPLEDSMESTMTKAETFAYELLSQQASPPSFKHTVPGGVFTQRPSKLYERFHPQVKEDNLTMNCCAHCKGEIKLA